MRHAPLPKAPGRSLVASLLLVPLLMSGSGPAVASAASPSGVPEIKITASEFAFSPSVVLLPLGQPIQLTIVNSGQLDHDVKSSIVISGLHYIRADNEPAEQKENAAKGVLDVDYEKGTTAQVTFVPTQPGVYEFHCDVTGHATAGMTGTLIVLPSVAVSQYQAHSGELLLRNASGQVYALAGRRLVPVPDLATFAAQGYTWDMVAQVPDSVIAAFPQGGLLPAAVDATSLHDGDVVKGSADNVYVVQGGQKQVIPDIGTFTKLGYTWERVKVVFDGVLDALTTGPARQP